MFHIIIAARKFLIYLNASEIVRYMKTRSIYLIHRLLCSHFINNNVSVWDVTVWEDINLIQDLPQNQTNAVEVA